MLSRAREKPQSFRALFNSTAPHSTGSPELKLKNVKRGIETTFLNVS